MTETKTIQNVAREILNNMERKTRPDGSTFYALKETIDWQWDIVYAAHDNGNRMPNDDLYGRIHDVLCHIDETDEYAGEDDIRDSFGEIEPDCYTANLTRWLHDHNGNVYYLTQALEESEIKDGFQALAYAQSIYIREIADAILSGIVDYIETIE